MNRFYEFNQVRKHRKEVQRIAKEKGYSFPFHDFLKMVNILIFGDKIATKLHRKFSNHHAHMRYLRIYYNEGLHKYSKIQPAGRYIKNEVEAIIDWESARFTKPEKQLTAYETWQKFYSDIDMKETLRMLGFWPSNI
jgi:hypothetical protein